MASSDPAAHQLQLSLVADFLHQHGMTASLAALGEKVGSQTPVIDRSSLVKSLRLSKLAAKSSPDTTALELMVSYFFKSTDLAGIDVSALSASAPEQTAPVERTPAPVVPTPAPVVPTPAPAAAEPVAPPTGPVAAPAPAPAAAAPAQAGGFWARLQAQKAAAAPTPADAPVEPASTPTPAPAAAAPAPEPAPSGKGAFWARLQAQKAAAAAEASGPQTFAFTAPDGKGFNDKHKYRQYMFNTYYSFTKRTGETLTKLPGQIEGQQFGLADLTDCTVLLCDHSDAVHVDRCKRCHIFIAASSNSIFLRNCSDCTFTVACKQLRTRDTADCTVFLYSKTDPVIEATTRMQFAPFNAACPSLTQAFAAANLQPTNNHWSRVFDFHKGDGTYAMPHWTFLPDSEWTEWNIDLAQHGIAEQPVNPVPKDAVADPATVMEAGGISQVAPSTGTSGAAPSDMKTFDIRTTSAADAAAAVQ